MNLKVYHKKETNEVENNPINQEQQRDTFYESPKLIRENGLYYIGYETDKIEIEEWEAVQVYEHPETVYDVIISHRRKFYFNTAEDSPSNMFHFSDTIS